MCVNCNCNNSANNTPECCDSACLDDHEVYLKKETQKNKKAFVSLLDNAISAFNDIKQMALIDEPDIDRTMHCRTISAVSKLLTGISDIKESPAVKRLRHEFDCMRNKNELYQEDILGLLSYVLESGRSIVGDLDVIKNILDWNPITPLTFKDDEFGDYLDSVGYSWQNNRNCEVFKDVDKDGNVVYTNVRALTLDTIGTVNMRGSENVYESCYIHNYHTGPVYIYNRLTNSWLPSSSGCHHIRVESDYIDQTFVLPVIELYDPEDKENDFFAFIADSKDIPEEFYRYYYLTGETPTEDDKKIIEALNNMGAKDWFDKPIENIEIFKDFIYYPDKIKVVCNYIKGKTLIKETLNKYGIGYGYASLGDFYDNNEIIINLKRTDAIDNALSSLMLQYDKLITFKDKEE